MFTITWSCRKNRSWDNWSQWKRMATYWRLILAYNDHLCAEVQVCSCKERVHCSSPQNLQLTQECVNHYNNKSEILFLHRNKKFHESEKLLRKQNYKIELLAKTKKKLGVLFLSKKREFINLTIYLYINIIPKNVFKMWMCPATRQQTIHNQLNFHIWQQQK